MALIGGGMLFTHVHTVAPYAWGDAEWAAVVACVTQVYSPYDITIAETVPPAGTASMMR